jgi:hypothetical protein
MRKTPCVKIKPVQSRVFHLLQMDKVELKSCTVIAQRASAGAGQTTTPSAVTSNQILLTGLKRIRADTVRENDAIV